jgi:hypothetical protein
MQRPLRREKSYHLLQMTWVSATIHGAEPSVEPAATQSAIFTRASNLGVMIHGAETSWRRASWCRLLGQKQN